MRRLWKDYNLSIVLLVLFLVSWAVQTWAGWMNFSADQLEHGQAAEFFGASGYVWQWAAATFENWQSEFLQLLTFVVLTAFLIHKGSHESKDTDEEMMALLKRIDQRLGALESGAQMTSKR
jgi:4-amino-4-deoxy-L-arabinose transferase-like glycosyltransferase